MNEDFSQRARSAADTLAEHYDSVLVICTVNIDGETYSVGSDRGNYYANIGAVKEWLHKKKVENALSVKGKSDE